MSTNDLSGHATVGRIVHFYGEGNLPHAAIVTAETIAELTELRVLGHPGQHDRGLAAPYSPAPAPGAWSWPPRGITEVGFWIEGTGGVAGDPVLPAPPNPPPEEVIE